MNKNTPKRTTPAALGATLALVLAALVLAACGSSSTGSTTTATTTAKTAASGPGAVSGSVPPGLSKRFAAIQECMKKNHLTLPARKPGQAGLLSPGASASARLKLREVLKKCGSKGGGGGLEGRLLTSPRYRAALAKFYACMQKEGVNLPKPNLTGNGPVFSANNAELTSPAFKAADEKCAPLLRPSGAPAGSAPPAGGSG